MTTYADETAFRVGAPVSRLHMDPGLKLLHGLDLLELGNGSAAGDLGWQGSRSRRSRSRAKTATHVGGSRGRVVLIGTEIGRLEGRKSRGAVCCRRSSASKHGGRTWKKRTRTHMVVIDSPGEGTSSQLLSRAIVATEQRRLAGSHRRLGTSRGSSGMTWATIGCSWENTYEQPTRRATPRPGRGIAKRRDCGGSVSRDTWPGCRGLRLPWWCRHR